MSELDIIAVLLDGKTFADMTTMVAAVEITLTGEKHVLGFVKTVLSHLQQDLEDRNQSAAHSLAEGLEEMLTWHQLRVFALLGLSFKTTNCLKSINALVEERYAKVNRGKSSNRRERWLATMLLDIETRLWKVKGSRHLPRLHEALRRDVNIEKGLTKKVA